MDASRNSEEAAQSFDERVAHGAHELTSPPRVLIANCPSELLCRLSHLRHLLQLVRQSSNPTIPDCCNELKQMTVVLEGDGAIIMKV